MKAVLKVDGASELDIAFGLVLCLFLQYSNKFQNWFQPWTRFEGNIDSGVELGYTACKLRLATALVHPGVHLIDIYN